MPLNIVYQHDVTLQNRSPPTTTCRSSISTQWTAPTSSSEPPEGITIGCWIITLETGMDLATESLQKALICVRNNVPYYLTSYENMITNWWSNVKTELYLELNGNSGL